MTAYFVLGSRKPHRTPEVHVRFSFACAPLETFDILCRFSRLELHAKATRPISYWNSFLIEAELSQNIVHQILLQRGTA